MQDLNWKARERRVGLWLFCVAAMVFIMVVLGGLTRLTESGLSMVNWRPVSGWLPPLSIEEWQNAFDLYKQSPQYHKVNFGMTLEEFQNIFWLEFFHRLWGRLIGLAFGIPLLVFIVRGYIRSHMVLPLLGLFVLGGAQGGLGWFMVKSGLVDHPEVSQYRLMAHLGFAFILYGALIWTGLHFYRRNGRILQIEGLAPKALGIWIISFVTILAGALVAGLDAGLTYNTFPLMDGDLVPSGLFMQQPWYLNFFENITTVQFQHRLLALTTFFLICWIGWSYRHIPLVRLSLAVVLIQVCLGIATLLSVVQISLATLHQAGGLLVFSVFTWLNFELRTTVKK